MPEEFECDECGRSFDSGRGLSLHQTQSHGQEGDEEKEAGSEKLLTIRKPSLTSRKMGIGLLFVGILLGFAAGYMSPDLSTLMPEEEPKVDVNNIDIEGEPSLGPDDAEVVVVEYTDYQCPFCRRHATATMPKIVQNYVNEGKVKYVVKDFPVPQLGHNRAVKMAKAANCAQEQDKYWDVHEKFFQEQNEIAPRSTAKFESSKIDQWAEEAGLNMEQYNQCMANTSNEEINNDKKEAVNFETKINGRQFVSGTPSFVIYSQGDSEGEPIVGAQPYSVFKNMIDAKLES